MKKVFFLIGKHIFNFIVFYILIPLLRGVYHFFPQRKSNRALFITIFYIGDTLYSTPAIRLLKKNRPDLKIDIFVNRNSVPIVQYNPDIDTIIVDNSKITINNTIFTFMRKIKANYKNIIQMIRNNYDYVFDVSGGFEAAIFTALAGRKKKYGVLKSLIFKNAYNDFAVDNNRLLHLKKMPCEVVAKSGISLTDYDYPFTLNIPAEDINKINQVLLDYNINNNLIVIAPFAGWKTKEWPLEYFIELADLLINRSFSIIIIGSKSEQIRYEKSAIKFSPKVINFLGKTTLFESAALIKKASLFIGCDSSQALIAEVLKTPLIKIFGSTHPGHTAPEESATNKVIYKEVKCSPKKSFYCSNDPLLYQCPNNHECMRKITVDELYNASIKIINIRKTID